jgi:hypothetical protein
MKKYFVYLLFAGLGALILFILVQTIRVKNTGFETKTLWDWMELLIIPLVLAGGAFFLNRSERAVERQIAGKRAKLEREIATDRQQEAALQSYLDRMAELLLQEKLRTNDNEEARDVARTLTLTVFRGLDSNRKGMVLRFLYEAELVCRGKPIVCLKGADLRGADLHGIDLSQANLYSANLFDADLSDSDLSGVIFNDATLFNVNLSGVDLRGAYLNEADLQSSNLVGANLSGAHLNGTNFCSSNLTDARLDNACLTGANLKGAKVPKELFASVKSLVGVKMPDGTIHE